MLSRIQLEPLPGPNTAIKHINTNANTFFWRGSRRDNCCVFFRLPGDPQGIFLFVFGFLEIPQRRPRSFLAAPHWGRRHGAQPGLREFVWNSRHPDPQRAWKGGSEPRLLPPHPLDPADPLDRRNEFQIVQIHCAFTAKATRVTLRCNDFFNVFHGPLV